MQLLTYLHDPDNLYIPLIKDTEIPEDLKNTVVAVSPPTTDKVKKLVDEAGFIKIEGADTYGTARLNLIKYAAEKIDDDYYFLCDFDKFMHWLNTDPEEFISILNSKPEADLTVVARSERALSTYPETWIYTENIASRILAKILRQQVDFMNGPMILSKNALKLIAKEGVETGLGSCAEFPLIVNKAGMTIQNLVVDGLTWEDPDRYVDLIEKANSFDEWKYDTYHSLYEWRKRVVFLNKQVEVMIRFSEEPINPKYPAVHNRTME